MFDAARRVDHRNVIAIRGPHAYRFQVDQPEQATIPNTPNSVDTVSRVARLGDRAFAAFLDFFIPMPLLGLIGTLEAVHVNAIDDGSYSLTGAPALLAMVLMFLAWMTYAVVAEFQFDGTIGKHIMGIAARTCDRRSLTLLQALVRNLARVVDAVGLYLVGFLVALDSKSSQRIGDRLANTAVFEREKSDRMVGVLYGIAVFVVGIFANLLAFHLAASQN
jgi:uncharacterized RDD family membrane protein YckC